MPTFYYSVTAIVATMFQRAVQVQSRTQIKLTANTLLGFGQAFLSYHNLRWQISPYGWNRYKLRVPFILDIIPSTGTETSEISVASAVTFAIKHFIMNFYF
jgi:hypothetical protein